jgi:hypothetical protein
MSPRRKIRQHLTRLVRTVGLWLWKWRELFSRISAPIFFPVFSYPFLDRFFYIYDMQISTENIYRILIKTNWLKLRKMAVIIWGGLLYLTGWAVELWIYHGVNFGQRNPQGFFLWNSKCEVYIRLCALRINPIPTAFTTKYVCAKKPKMWPCIGAAETVWEGFLHVSRAKAKLLVVHSGTEWGTSNTSGEAAVPARSEEELSTVGLLSIA